MPATKKNSVTKTTITNPLSGIEKKIDESIYTPFKAAIVQSLKTTKGKTFTEIADDVVKTIRKKMPGFKKSIPWYAISVLRDLEAKGVVENYIEKGEKLNRLKK